MFFLSPLALLGLAAALIPPLLHLFQRRRPPEVEFPAVRYLRQTERDAERQVRLQHLLLMALRVLAVVLLVTAAARPVVPGGSVGLHEPTALAIVFDNSLSSGTVAGGTRVLDDLALRARETLRAAQAGDAVWLIQADGIARRGTPSDLLASLTHAVPDARRLDLPFAVRSAALLLASSGYARREIHVLSDMQATAFGVGPGAGGQGPAVADTVLDDMPIIVYHPAGEPPANRGITAVRARPSVWLAGAQGGGNVTAEIGGGPIDANAGTASLQLMIGQRPGGRALAAAGAQAVLSAPRVEAGWQRGSVVLEPDELRADDERAFGIRVAAPAQVRGANEADVGPFVVQALSVLRESGQIGAAGTGQETSVATTIGAPHSIVFPPADPARIGATNRALAAAGVPWQFGPIVQREDSLVAPAIVELRGARVMMRHRLEAAARQDSGEILARAGNDPWLVRHGTIVLVASRMVPEHTPLPLSGAFVPFVNALVNRMGRGESGVIDALPGASVPLPARVQRLAGADSSISVQAGAVIEAPALPGVYALMAGNDTLGLLTVAHDPRESDLTRAGSRAVAAAFGGARAFVTSDAEQYGARRFRGAGQSELTGWLLVAALATLVLESLLAAGILSRREVSGKR